MDLKQYHQFRTFDKFSLLPIIASVSLSIIIHLLVFVCWSPLEKRKPVSVPQWYDMKLIAGIEKRKDRFIKKKEYKKKIKKTEVNKYHVDSNKKKDRVEELQRGSIEEKFQPTKNTAATLIKANSQPYSLDNPKPFYPSVARERGMQGTVILSIAVNEKGKVDDLSVIRSSGFKVLDRSALVSVKKWRFRPASRGNENVDSVIELPIKFILNDL